MNEKFITSAQKRSISLKVRNEVHQALRFYCIERDVTIQQVLEELLDEFLTTKKYFPIAKTAKKKVSKK
jgi:predicted transcriptional regulator YheO